MYKHGADAPWGSGILMDAICTTASKESHQTTKSGGYQLSSQYVQANDTLKVYAYDFQSVRLLRGQWLLHMCIL